MLPHANWRYTTPATASLALGASFGRARRDLAWRDGRLVGSRDHSRAAGAEFGARTDRGVAELLVEKPHCLNPT